MSQLRPTAAQMVLAIVAFLGPADASALQTEGRWIDVSQAGRGTEYVFSIAALADGTLLASGSAVFSSGDRGSTWSAAGQAPTPGVGQLSTHPDNEDVAYLNLGYGAFASSDAGSSWRRLVLPIKPNQTMDVAAGPDGRVDVALEMLNGDSFEYSTWRSEDSGQTWRKLANESFIRPADAGCGRVAIRARPFDWDLVCSPDDGRRWVRLLEKVVVYAVDPQNRNRIWAVQDLDAANVFAYHRGNLLRSDTAGASWHDLGELPFELARDDSIAVSATTLMYASKRGGFLTSDLSASSWTGSVLPSPVTVTLLGDPMLVALTGSEQSISTDGGATFSAFEIPRRSGNRIATFGETSRQLVGNVTHSFDGGETWQDNGFEGGGVGIREIAHLGEEVFAASSFGYLAVSEDGGGHWREVSPAVTHGKLAFESNLEETPPVLHWLEADPDSYPCSLRQHSSLDLGASWASHDFTCDTSSDRVASLDIDSVRSRALGLSFFQNAIGAATSFALNEWDLGSRQVASVELPLRDKSWSEARYLDGRILLAGPGLWETSDSGQNWRLLLDTDRVYNWAIHPRDRRVQVAATDQGLLRTVDGGETWSKIPGGEMAVTVDIASDSTTAVGAPSGVHLWTPAPSECRAGDPSTLCLGERFLAEALFDAGFGQQSAMATALTPDTGAFWFFDEDNLELVVKVLDGCGVNGHFWFFAAGLTDLSIEMLVTDTETGQVIRLASAGGPVKMTKDTSAFDSCDN